VADPPPPPGILDEDAAHGLRGGPEEVAPAVPRRRLVSTHEAQVRLMDQGGRLESVARPIGGQPGGGQFPQLVIDEGQEIRGGPAVLTAGGFQQAGDVGHAPDETGPADKEAGGRSRPHEDGRATRSPGRSRVGI
jgi:hypothetical protein